MVLMRFPLLALCCAVASGCTSLSNTNNRWFARASQQGAPINNTTTTYPPPPSLAGAQPLVTSQPGGQVAANTAPLFTPAGSAEIAVASSSSAGAHADEPLYNLSPPAEKKTSTKSSSSQSASSKKVVHEESATETAPAEEPAAKPAKAAPAGEAEVAKQSDGSDLDLSAFPVRKRTSISSR
jgi:hypothetical protein